MIAGGLFGSVVGAALFRLLQSSGQIDVVIGLLYVLILGWIGGLMLKDCAGHARLCSARSAPSRRGRATTAGSPRCRCAGASTARASTSRRSRRFALGFVAGVLTVFLGIGGGFILVPAMIYLLGMPARVVIGTSLVMILAVSAGDDHGPCADHPRGRHRACRPAARRRRDRRAIWRAADDRGSSPTMLRLALAIIILLVALRMFLGLVLAARRDLLDRISVSAPPRLARCSRCWRRCWSPPTSRCWCPTSPRARCRSATASPAPSCCCSARSSIPAGGRPTRPADIAVVLRGPGPADPGAREAEDRRHLDERRFQPLPLGAVLLRGRLVAADRATSSMSAPPRSTSSACTICSCRPAAARLPEKERRFEAGLLDLRHRHGPLCRGPARRRDHRRRALPRGHHHPQPGAGRHLHRRDLPDRPREGASPPRTRDIQISKSGFERFVALAARRHSLRLRPRRASLLSLGLGWAAAAAFRRRF